jgi:hypothetical protein
MSSFGVVILAIVCGFIALIIHEVGHAVVARACGWESDFLILFGLVVPLTARGRRVAREYKDFQGSMLGGAASVFPSEEQTDARWHYPAVLAGGPGITLVLFLLLLALSVLLEVEELWIVGLMFLANGIASLLPLTTGLMTTDGKRIWNLMRGGTYAEVERLRLRIGVAISNGTPPDLSEKELELLRSSRDKAAQYFGYAYSISRCRDMGRDDDFHQFKNDIQQKLSHDKALQTFDQNQFRLGDLTA